MTVILDDGPEAWTEAQRAAWPRLLFEAAKRRHLTTFMAWLHDAPPPPTRLQLAGLYPPGMRTYANADMSKALRAKLVGALVDFIMEDDDGYAWWSAAPADRDFIEGWTFSGYQRHTDWVDVRAVVEAALDSVVTPVAELIDGALKEHALPDTCWRAVINDATIPEPGGDREPGWGTDAVALLKAAARVAAPVSPIVVELLADGLRDDRMLVDDEAYFDFDPSSIRYLMMALEFADDLPPEMVAWLRAQGDAICAAWPDDDLCAAWPGG